MQTKTRKLDKFERLVKSIYDNTHWITGQGYMRLSDHEVVEMARAIKNSIKDEQ